MGLRQYHDYNNSNHYFLDLQTFRLISLRVPLAFNTVCIPIVFHSIFLKTLSCYYYDYYYCFFSPSNVIISVMFVPLDEAMKCVEIL